MNETTEVWMYNKEGEKEGVHLFLDRVRSNKFDIGKS